LLDGKSVRPATPKDAEEAGISTVYQEMNLIPSFPVAENIALGRQPGRFGFLNWGALRRHAREVLARLDLRGIDIDADPGSLSVAMQQMVAAARALDLKAKLPILASRPPASTRRKSPISLP
jgi:simple sugar transport system ATP-binding protein